MEFSNYNRQPGFQKQNIQQTEFMKITQTFQRPKMLHGPPKLTHCTQIFYVSNSKANFKQSISHWSCAVVTTFTEKNPSVVDF